MTTSVHLATTDDVEDMASLLALLFDQEAEFTPDRSLQITALNVILADPSLGSISVARRGRARVGMVLVLYTVSTALGGRVGTLEDLVVSPSVRGSGVGTLLMEHALTRAQADGCKRVTLLTDADNASAHRFYERTGFVRSDMVPFRMRFDSREGQRLTD